MSNTRALVSCTILSLQDSCFMYPSCKCCLSRITEENNKRATCAKCGFTCDLQNVDYRYRISFKVSRNKDIFGVTVFGGCLNTFFGITAGGLHRFSELEESKGTHSVQQLLIKAVEDCFIGRCIVLGLKVSYDDVTTWLADQQSSSLVSKSRQLVACQIISPSEAFAGFTVFGYFKNLLQSYPHSSHSESASSMCLSQQNDSSGSQRDELNCFDHTLPSCARLNSQPSSGEFRLSSVWQSPGLCFSPGEISNDSLQQPTDHDLSIPLPKNEGMRTCQSSLEDKCFWSCSLDQLKHVHGIQDELEDGAQSSDRNSLYKNDSKIMISSHYLLKALSEEQYDTNFDNSPINQSGPNICLDLENAPLSESLLDFVKIEPQLSEKIDAKQLRLSNKHSSGKRDEIYHDQCNNEMSNISKTASVWCNVNKKSWKKKNENDCPENHEIRGNNADIPNTPKVLYTSSFSGRKKNNMIHRDLNMNVSPDTVCAFQLHKNSRLCFSNRKHLTFQRKRLTRSRRSVAFCSLNHEEDKYFRHCVQSEVHSVNCKVKQEQIECEDRGDTYNCSADLFASCQNSMDTSHLDMTDISKINEPRNVNTSKPGVSGFLPFAPCLQSTPVSYQDSFRQKTGRSQKRVESLHSRGLKLEFKSEERDLKENRQKVTKAELDQLQTVGLTETFSDESDVQSKSCNSSVNINEWSKDLFEKSF